MPHLAIPAAERFNVVRSLPKLETMASTSFLADFPSFHHFCWGSTANLSTLPKLLPTCFSQRPRGPFVAQPIARKVALLHHRHLAPQGAGGQGHQRPVACRCQKLKGPLGTLMLHFPNFYVDQKKNIPQFGPFWHFVIPLTPWPSFCCSFRAKIQGQPTFEAGP